MNRAPLSIRHFAYATPDQINRLAHLGGTGDPPWVEIAKLSDWELRKVARRFSTTKELLLQEAETRMLRAEAEVQERTRLNRMIAGQEATSVSVKMFRHATLEQLSALLHIESLTLSGYLSGILKMNLQTKIAIASQFGMTLQELDLAIAARRAERETIAGLHRDMDRAIAAQTSCTVSVSPVRFVQFAPAVG